MQRFLVFTALLAVCLTARANTCVPLQAGATDQMVYVEFIDESTGAPNSSLAFNSSGIDLEYVRSGAAAADITEATQTAGGAHSDGGFVSVGHGRYRLDLPDAAVASGVPQVVIQGVITGYIMLPCVVALSPPVNVVAAAGTAWASGAITAASIATDAIGAAELAADAIGAAEIANAAIDAATFASAAIDATAIAADAIGASEIAADAIGASELATDAIGAAEIAASAITASELGDGSITSAEFASGAITAAAIASDAIGAAEVAADVSTELLSGLANLAVNVAQISGDSGAADALETAFDGTAGAVSPLGIARQGTAQSATGTTLVLDSSASFADDTAIGMTLVACGSTQGYCQSRAVTDYVSSTDTATVGTWTVTPSGTITYYLFGTAPASSSGGSGATAQEVWEYGARTLTALDEDSTTIDLNASYVGGVTVFDEDSTTIDINGTTIGTVTTATNVTTVNGLAANVITDASIAADAEARMQTEATDALNAYDPPTNAEMEARTLAAASYATAATQATIAAYIDTEIAALLVGVNVEQINGVTITGDGSGTPFGVTP